MLHKSEIKRDYRILNLGRTASD